MGITKTEARIMGALFIDVILVLLFLKSVGESINQQVKILHIGSYGLPILFFLVLSLEALPMALMGGTVGMTILRVKIQDRLGQKPNLFQAYYLVFVLNFTAFGNRGRGIWIPKSWEPVLRA